MREQWKITKELGNLPTKGESGGYCYAIELGDNIKIGCTNDLRTRLSALKGNAINYSNVIVGRFAYTELHGNYKDNEKKLHTFFSDCRFAKSELFGITLDSFLDESPILDLDKSDDEEDVNNGVYAMLVSLQPGFAEFLVEEYGVCFSCSEMEKIGNNLEFLGRADSIEVQDSIYTAQGDKIAEKDFFDRIPNFTQMKSQDGRLIISAKGYN